MLAVAAWALLRLISPRPPASASATASHLALATATPSPQPWRAEEITRLRAALNDAFAPAIGGTDRFSLAVDGADGVTIYDNSARRAVAPASVQKLIVAATALETLGAAYRYHTLLASSQAIGNDGTLPGNLWLVGSGDPSFRDDALRGGVKTLARSGLTKIEGGVQIDATGMRGPEFNPHWDPDDTTEDYGAPTSAISLDGDTVEFDVEGTSAGAAADVRVVPPSADVHVSGQIVTSDSSDDVTIAATAARNTFTLSGHVPPNTIEKYWLPIQNVPKYAGAVLQKMLADAGISTGAPPSTSAAPIDSIVLWDHRSAPLRVLEAHMLFLSDNHYAEQLLRTAGGETSGTASDESGLQTERDFLSARGIPTPGLRVNDASGLAPDNRVAAITFARLLSDAELRGGPSSLYMLLPLGGRQGTLKYYDFTTALGRVRAKSGHIGGVSSLAGYVNTLHHGRIAFAFLINGSPGNPDAAIVQAVNRLASF